MFKLNRDDVDVLIIGGSRGGPSGNFDRRLKETQCSMIATHKPTGLQIRVDIPPGHYSKKEMRDKKNNLERALITALAAKVAERLCAKGR